MMTDRGKPKVLEKTCTSISVSARNSIQSAIGLNPNFPGEKLASNYLSYGTGGGILSCIFNLATR
jgi:hypothetical protein